MDVAFKSDHPVINSQHLIYEAAKAHAYGFDPKLAIAAVTSVPAKLMGQEWRIGMVSEGFDADLVVWDRYPLNIGASPVLVITDGLTTLSKLDLIEVQKEQVQSNLSKIRFDIPKDVSNSFKMINISYIYADRDKTFQNGEVVVLNGIIDCIGETGLCSKAAYSDLEVIDANGGSVIPVFESKLIIGTYSWQV